MCFDTIRRGIQPDDDDVDLTGVLHILECLWHHCSLCRFLLQQNPEWFDILVPPYLGCPGIPVVKSVVLLYGINKTVH